MSKKSKKASMMRTNNKITPGRIAAYSVYATGATATATIGATLVLDNAKMSRKERKKLRKVRDAAAMVTVVGAMSTMVYTTYATMTITSKFDSLRYVSLFDEDEEDDED